MIISISPPSSVSLRSIEKQTRLFFGKEQLIKKINHGLIATKNRCMVLVKKREILLSFDSNDADAIVFLQNYLSHLFKGLYIGVDLDNPITDSLNFVVRFPEVWYHEKQIV